MGEVKRKEDSQKVGSVNERRRITERGAKPKGGT